MGLKQYFDLKNNNFVHLERVLFCFSRVSGDIVLVVEHGRHTIGCKKKERKNLDLLDYYNLKKKY